MSISQKMSGRVASRTVRMQEAQRPGRHSGQLNISRDVTYCFADFLSVVLAGAAFCAIYPGISRLLYFLPILLGVAALNCIVGVIFGRYRAVRFGAGWSNNLGKLFLAWFAAWSVGITVTVILKDTATYSRIWLFGWLFSAAAMMICLRWAMQHLHFFRKALRTRIILIGAASDVDSFVGRLPATLVENFDLVGRYSMLKNDKTGNADDKAVAEAGESAARIVPHHGYGLNNQAEPIPLDYASVSQLVKDGAIDDVILVGGKGEETWVPPLLQVLTEHPVSIRVYPRFLTTLPNPSFYASHVPHLTIGFDSHHIGKLALMTKSFYEFVIALFLLTLSAPLMLLIALAIRLESRGPVLFLQQRCGYNKRVFKIFKFRTMVHSQQDVTGSEQTERFDPRITKIGQLLRVSSLDELPQLLNVLRGEMALVGPRPHALGSRIGDVLFQDSSQFYSIRHNVKPGMTGLAQVRGLRGAVVTEDQIQRRVEADLNYIRNWSIGLDLRIMLQTVASVWKRQNAF